MCAGVFYHPCVYMLPLQTITHTHARTTHQSKRTQHARSLAHMLRGRTGGQTDGTGRLPYMQCMIILCIQILRYDLIKCRASVVSRVASRFRCARTLISRDGQLSRTRILDATAIHTIIVYACYGIATHCARTYGYGYCLRASAFASPIEWN